MGRLVGKNIILGVSGSIAAYKAAILLRLFKKEGAHVQVIITPSGKEFITPVTLSALSEKPVLSEFFEASDGAWNSHVDLGLWADIMIIAPATATTMGKMANGIADNMLVTTYLSARCPVLIAPAMDLDMFAHPSTQRNISILKDYGNIIIEPGEGELASGLQGKGRMEEPENILEFTVNNLTQEKKLKDKVFLVTAGPTYEKIDPVRFIGNYSSGKMGYAIAETLAEQGAKVTLVSGPVAVATSNPRIKVMPVESAEEMYKKSVMAFEQANGAIMCAAVSDFTPIEEETEKKKRKKDIWTINLKPTKDIAAELGRRKTKQQLLVGFALETNDELENARKKLEKKNLDFIVLNSLNDKGVSFGADTNKITIIDKDNNLDSFELKSKAEVAKDIVQKIIELNTQCL